ncbi:MAG TPA: TIGR03118 family protein [Acetobacteraceae bacterium]|nr:TIGR03118 family protein [Acetobacteraceae bacterium]
MTTNRAYLSRTVAATSLLLGVAAAPAHAVILFQETSLVSDGFVPAATTDPDLINPWGVSFSPTSPFWVSDNGTGLATLYDGAGMKRSLVVTIPPASGSGTSAPTGQVFNGVSGGFKLSNGAPAVFLFASEDGAISGWNPGLGTTAAIAFPPVASAVYKGLAIDNGGAHLFAANFRSGKVEMYDQDFGLVKSFTDTTLPSGYAPFNARVLNGQLYVTFALQDAAKHDDVAGHGHGFVDVFDLNGNFVRRLVSNGDLNSPWGLEIAPSNFGGFAGSLLVGNFGDGTISAYDATTGAFLGVLRDTHFNPLHFGDLWALTLGDGAGAGNPNTLYFTAGLQDEAHGLFGSIEALNVPEPATALILLAGLGGLALTRRRA